MDAANATIAAAFKLHPAAEPYGFPSTPASQHFTVPAGALPMQQLPEDAVAALRGVLPAWRAAVAADEPFLEYQLPTKDAFQVS